jgi:hypothetical protein
MGDLTQKKIKKVYIRVYKRVLYFENEIKPFLIVIFNGKTLTYTNYLSKI